MSKWALFFTLALASAAQAADLSQCSWRITRGEGTIAVPNCPELIGLKVQLNLSGGRPRIVSWGRAPMGAEHWLLVYAVDGIGTQVQFTHEIGVLVYAPEKRIVGHTLYRLPHEEEDNQPNWVWSEDGVYVENLPFGEAKLDYKFPVLRAEDGGAKRKPSMTR